MNSSDFDSLKDDLGRVGFEKIEVALAGGASTTCAVNLDDIYSGHECLVTLSPDQSCSTRWMCDADLDRMLSDVPALLQGAHDWFGNALMSRDRPSLRWLIDDAGNYAYLHVLFTQMAEEYKYRFGHDHLCGAFVQPLTRLPSGYPSSLVTQGPPPPQCIPVEYRIPHTTQNFRRWDNAVAAWRAYYLFEKHNETWTEVDPPDWLVTDDKWLTDELRSIIWQR